MSKNNSIKQASIKQLEQELNKRKAAKIAELNQAMANIAKEINDLGGDTISKTPEVNPPAKKIIKIKKSMAKIRVTNEKSLKDLLVSIGEDGAERTVTEYLSELISRGWKSSSAKPYYVVGAALATQEKKNVFQRVIKGSYKLIKS